MAFMQRIRRGGVRRRRQNANGSDPSPDVDEQPAEPQFQFPNTIEFTYSEAYSEVYQAAYGGSYSRASSSYPRSRRECYHVAFLLGKKLVRDLVPRIMDYAEYWSVEETSFDIRRKIHSAPEGMALLATPPLTAQQARRVRRVTFVTMSTDQGWGGEPKHQGTLEGGWTWFEVHMRQCGTPPFVYDDGPWKRQREGAPRNEGVNPWDPYNGRRLISNYTAVDQIRTQSVTWRYDADADRDCGGDEDQAREQRFNLRDMGEGDQIVLTAHASFSGWTNYVDRVGIVLEFGHIR